MLMKRITILFMIIFMFFWIGNIVQNVYADDAINELWQLLNDDNGNSDNGNSNNVDANNWFDDNTNSDVNNEFDNTTSEKESATNLKVKLDNDNYNKTFSSISEKFAFLGVQNIFHVTKLLGVFNCLQDIWYWTVNGVKGNWVILNKNCKVKGQLNNTEPINTWFCWIKGSKSDRTCAFNKKNIIM